MIKRDAAITVRDRAIRLQRERPLLAGQRLLVPSQLMQNDTPAAVSPAIVGPPRQRQLEARQRLVIPLERTQRIAAIVVQLGRILP